MDMYFVYVLENRDDGSFYVGYTTSIDRRLNEHVTGKGGQTTRRTPNWQLIYYEAYLNKHDALGRERFLKGGSGRKYLHRQLKNYLGGDNGSFKSPS